MVDVEDEERERLRVALGALDLGGGELVELAPVEGAGQRIVGGELLELEGESLQLLVALGELGARRLKGDDHAVERLRELAHEGDPLAEVPGRDALRLPGEVAQGGVQRLQRPRHAPLDGQRASEVALRDGE